MNWLLSEIAAACDGELRGADLAVNGVSTDTRAIAAGQLFVALAGERFDAHDFLPQALAAGACALLVSDAERCPATVPSVLVADTRLALGRLAAAWRARFSLPLIAVTGSNGKTTTKGMIASILAAEYGESAVLATRGNLNNDIGLPMTLLGLGEQHRAAVIEMGMNHPGEIAYLANIARASAAVVTNAQRAHLEGLGSLAGIAAEKGAIYEGLAPDGVAAVCGDKPFAESWCAQAGPRQVLRFGCEPGMDVQGSMLVRGLDSRLGIDYAGRHYDVDLRVPGSHNARNALAAAAVCLAARIPAASVVAGLAAFPGVKGRLQCRQTPAGVAILDDTYNANPDSVRAGIDVLASTIGRKLLVLGDMGEIGDASAQYHDEVGGYAKSQGIDRLYALGEHAQIAARSFGEGGRHFRSQEELLAALDKDLSPDATVLVKGSRFMRMERISDALAGEAGGEKH
jgi:UDP-N-acetylmuramoyl-tripeptide--D-alanyl-D-alanine ligase